MLTVQYATKVAIKIKDVARHSSDSAWVGNAMFLPHIKVLNRRLLCLRRHNLMLPRAHGRWCSQIDWLRESAGQILFHTVEDVDPYPKVCWRHCPYLLCAFLRRHINRSQPIKRRSNNHFTAISIYWEHEATRPLVSSYGSLKIGAWSASQPHSEIECGGYLCWLCWAPLGLGKCIMRYSTRTFWYENEIMQSIYYQQG